MFSQQVIIAILALIATIGGGVGLAVYDRRPRKSLTPSLIPTTPLILLSGLLTILAIVHLFNVIGIKTGS
jgi:hypothetical protein